MLLEAPSHESTRRRFWCDGRSGNDLEQRPCSCPARTTRQPYLGKALPSPAGEWGIKEPLNKACFLLDLAAYRGSLVIQSCGRKTYKKEKTHLAAWNVRTLQDNPNNLERQSAIVAQELKRFNIAIAALSETRLPGSTQLTEHGAGYTFFCSGRPDGEPRHAGVGFAIQNRYLSLLDSVPHGVNERLMTLRLNLKSGYVTLISAYAPTMTHTDETKEQFYEELDRLVQATPHSDKLLLLGDFNARVGKCYTGI